MSKEIVVEALRPDCTAGILERRCRSHSRPAKLGEAKRWTEKSVQQRSRLVAMGVVLEEPGAAIHCHRHKALGSMSGERAWEVETPLPAPHAVVAGGECWL